MQVKEAIEQLIGLYIQQDGLTELIKEIKDKLKDEGHNAAVIASVAKAMSQGKENELAEKSQEVLDVVELAKG